MKRKSPVKFLRTALVCFLILVLIGGAFSIVVRTTDINWRFWEKESNNNDGDNGGKIQPTLLEQSVSFAQDSWEIISAVSATGQAIDYYSVGDEKDIEIDGVQYTFLILGFNHDDLSDDTGRAGISIGMKNLLAKTYTMNAQNNSWHDSTMRNVTLENIFLQLPQELQAVVKQVNKNTSIGGANNTVRTDSVEKLWFFSQYEIFPANYGVTLVEGYQYEYWKNIGADVEANRIKYLLNGSGVVSGWWLRSPCKSNADQFAIVTNKGAITGTAVFSYQGICFGFCV